MNSGLVIAALILIILGMLLVFVQFSDDSNLHTKLQNLGTALITAGIISLVLDSIAVKSMSSKLSGVLHNNLRELRIRDFGMSDVVDRLPFNQLYSELEVCKSFDVVQTWVPNLSPFLQHAEQMFIKGGRIRVFLLHPASASAGQRSHDLNKVDQPFISNKIKTDIRDVKSFYKTMERQNIFSKSDMKERLQLKLYATLPTCSIHKIDQKAWVGFYWLGIQSDEGMTLVISDNEKNNKALNTIKNQIEELDKKSIQVDLDTDKIPTLKSVMEKSRV